MSSIPPSPPLDETISVGQTRHIMDHEQIAEALNDLSAANLPFTPVGTIGATNVQAAIVEVADESARVDIDVRAYGVVMNAAGNQATQLQAALSFAGALVSGAFVVGARVVSPAGQINVGAQIKIPPKVVFRGAGKRSTSITAIAGTFPTNTPVVRLGLGTGIAFDARIEEMEVDCSNIAGSTAVFSDEGQEGAGASHVVAFQFRNKGFHYQGFSGGGSASIMHMDNIECLWNQPGITAPIHYEGVDGQCLLEHVTLTGGSAPNLAPTGIWNEASDLHIESLHTEFINDSVLFDDFSSGTVIGALGNPGNTGPLVHITTLGKGNFFGLNPNGGPSTLVDDAVGATYLYAIGEYIAGRETGSIVRAHGGAGSPIHKVTNIPTGSGGSSMVAGTSVAEFASVNTTDHQDTQVLHVQTAPGSFNRAAKFENGNVVFGTVRTVLSQLGFPHIPTMPGPPAAVPFAESGCAPMVVDTVTGRLYFYYGAAWHYAALT